MATGTGCDVLGKLESMNPGASVKDPQARNLPAAFNTAAIEVQP